MRWLRSNAGWLGLAFALTTGIAGLYVKAALAETDKRIAVHEAKQEDTDRRITEMAQDVKDIKRYLMSREPRR